MLSPCALSNPNGDKGSGITADNEATSEEVDQHVRGNKKAKQNEGQDICVDTVIPVKPRDEYLRKGAYRDAIMGIIPNVDMGDNEKKTFFSEVSDQEE